MMDGGVDRAKCLLVCLYDGSTPRTPMLFLPTWPVSPQANLLLSPIILLSIASDRFVLRFRC